MILLDGLNTHLRQQQRMISQVVRILSQIAPEKRVAVFTLGNTLRTIHAFTSDRASLVAKLARYAGVARMTARFTGLAAARYSSRNRFISRHMRVA
jgi:hypothetical protein